MPVLRYLSHPEVACDPEVPVPDWGLRARGHARMRVIASLGWPAGTTRIVASAERKARETAAYLAESLGLTIEIAEGMGEIDRSSTGYVPHAKHEELANAMFAHPEDSIEGWERAVDAQARAAAALCRLLTPVRAGGTCPETQVGDLLLVGHGGIGTLLWCHLAGRLISRAEDQTHGGGNVWAVTLPDLVPVHSWRAMETVAGL